MDLLSSDGMGTELIDDLRLDGTAGPRGSVTKGDSERLDAVGTGERKDLEDEKDGRALDADRGREVDEFEESIHGGLETR